MAGGEFAYLKGHRKPPQGEVGSTLLSFVRAADQFALNFQLQIDSAEPSGQAVNCEWANNTQQSNSSHLACYEVRAVGIKTSRPLV